MIYSICGLLVKYSPKYNQTLARSQKYLTDDNTSLEDIDFSIEVCDEEIADYMEKYPLVPDYLAEYIIYGSKFYTEIVKYNAFFLHSSAVAVDNKAYLFSALSGTGKSTHTNLWIEHFGDRATMINDDKPVVRIIDKKIYACGTPFSGKFDINSNILVPLQGICMLSRGTQNSIVRIDNKEAIAEILDQTIRTNQKDFMINCLDTLDKVLLSIPVYRLKCDISDDAVLVAYNAMKSGENSGNI